jgi:hypothetical protein
MALEKTDGWALVDEVEQNENQEYRFDREAAVRRKAKYSRFLVG